MINEEGQGAGGGRVGRREMGDTDKSYWSRERQREGRKETGR